MARLALTRPKRDPEGRMALGAHLRELRNRFLVAVGSIVVVAIPGWIWYPQLLLILEAPLRAAGGTLNYQNLTDPFAVQLGVSLFVGVIVASPIWLWQLWAFIVPGLTRRERRTALAFIVCAVPLFLSGCWLAYTTLPKAIAILLGFTPTGAMNIMPAGDYLRFVTRFILAFGLAFLLPVLLVGLNVAHVLSAKAMLAGWRIAVIGLFVFAAVMTPTPDPWTMLALALPMCALYFAACGVAWLIDRRRAKNRPEWADDLADDEASSL